MNQASKIHRRPKVGVFGLGLTAYWPQFAGMKARIEATQQIVERELGACECDVTSAGVVDCDAAALSAGSLFCRTEVDLIVLYLGTYGTSSLALRTIQRRRVPVLLLNLQPAPALDYTRATTEDMLVHCSSCILPELCGVFNRASIPFSLVSGTLDAAHPAGAHAWRQVSNWVKAARVACNVQSSRFGFLGHTYPGMLDLYADMTAHHIQLGTHIELLEICDLSESVAGISDSEVARKVEETRSTFDIASGSAADPLARAPDKNALTWSARVACGLEQLARDRQLDGLTYYYRGRPGNEYERLAGGWILGNTLLTARGIPCAGEGDLKTCFAMYIMEILGAGGSFTEFYAMDLNDKFMLMAHDGPGHIAISNRKPILRGLELFHGKSGAGISVEFNVRLGPVTILGLTQTPDGRLRFIAAEGESVPGPILRIGNTNSRIKFAKEPAEFLAEWTSHGPTHHVALGIGHVLTQVEYVAKLLNLELCRVG